LKLLKFLWKGLANVPGYFAYWGVLTSCFRIFKALFLPAAHGLVVEMANYLELRKHRVKSKRMPDYIVVAPDFVSTSAGIRCLYALCADLQNLGFETAIQGSVKGNAASPLPLISLEDAKNAAQNGAWVVYPEVIAGNPLDAKNVVRWVLNRPGLLGGEKVYPDSEHIFIYSDVYAEYVKNPIRGKLYMPTIDRNLFYPPRDDFRRSLECYYVGKSKFKSGVLDPDTTFEITRFTPAKSELGKLFRVSKMLYCFDNSTALIYEALLCGCPVTIIPDGTQTWADYQNLELGTDGIHWWPEAGSIHNSLQLSDRLDRLEREYHRQVRELVTYTQRIHPSPHKRIDHTLDLKAKERSSRPFEISN